MAKVVIGICLVTGVIFLRLQDRNKEVPYPHSELESQSEE